MIKQVTEIDSAFLSKLDSSLEEIKRGLKNMNAIPEKEYLTANEFMDKIKISRWKFDLFIKDGVLEYRKIGRKYYVPQSQVVKYFAGEMI
jgi:hypothetical protein